MAERPKPGKPPPKQPPKTDQGFTPDRARANSISIPHWSLRIQSLNDLPGDIRHLYLLLPVKKT